MSGGRRPRAALPTLPVAGALILAGWSGAAIAGDLTIVATGDQAASAKVELIDSSRLGCSAALSTTASVATECAFDTATSGAKFSVRQEAGASSLAAYATIARTTEGAFTPDQMLTSPAYRSSTATNVAMVGMTGSAFNDRLKLVAQVARTERVVDELIDQDGIDQDHLFGQITGLGRRLDDHDKLVGTSASVRFDAKLMDKPGLKWSVSGQYQTASDDFSIGRSQGLALNYLLPGTRLTVSTKARMGQFGISAGLDQASTPFGVSTSRKAGLDMDGLSLSVVSRDSSVRPVEGSTLLNSRTSTTSAYLDVDPELLAGSLFPDVTELPFFVPSTISLSYRSGETETRYQGTDERYAKASLGIDGSWDTPLGETSLSYWRDTRTGVTAGAHRSMSETFGADHYVRRGHWRFGLDASLMRTRSEGAVGYEDQTLSFGQSVSYSAPEGPEFRLQMGQDRGSARSDDLSYASADRYSSITASLDLSQYLQKRFARPDLHLTLDYRKMLDRTDSEMSLYDQLAERWMDRYRREGFLMSFGMKL